MPENTAIATLTARKQTLPENETTLPARKQPMPEKTAATTGTPITGKQSLPRM